MHAARGATDALHHVYPHNVPILLPSSFGGCTPDTSGERLTGSQTWSGSIPSVSTTIKNQPETNVLGWFFVLLSKIP